MVLLTEQAHQELVGTTQTSTLENARLKAENQWLKEQFRLARHRRFGASSEKAEPTGQESPIFNEAEVGADPALPEPSVEVVTHSRRKSSGHREEQLADLPAEDVEHRIKGDAQASIQGVAIHRIRHSPPTACAAA